MADEGHGFQGQQPVAGLVKEAVGEGSRGLAGYVAKPGPVQVGVRL